MKVDGKRSNYCYLDEYTKMKKKEALELRNPKNSVRHTRSVAGGCSEIAKTGNRI